MRRWRHGAYQDHSVFRVGIMLTMAVQVNRAFETSDVDVEECDDGNIIQFDGCDQHCLIEPAYRCTPNASNPVLSNCTSPGIGGGGKETDWLEVFLNFGMPAIGCGFLCCCCVGIKRFRPNVLKWMLPFGIHEKLALAGLGLDEIDQTKKREKVKTNAQIRAAIQEEHNVAKHINKALEKRADFRAWNLRFSVVEAGFLPVTDMAIRDAKLVGLSDPYATVRVVAADASQKNKKVWKTDTKYSTLFPYWGKEFRINFDSEEDLIVVDVWDWDAGKKDDWIGRVEFKGWYFIEGYLEGAPYGRVGHGGGVPSEAARKAGVLGSPYFEESWYDILNKKGKTIVNKTLKKHARIYISFRIDKNYDPVENIEKMVQNLYERKTYVDDALQLGKDALARITKHCTFNSINVRQVVEAFDRDGDGDIDKDELHAGLSKLGIEPKVEMREVEGIFEVLRHLDKLNAQGDIRLKDFADSISLSDAHGLFNALKRHSQPQIQDLQRLGSTPAAFHNSSMHSFDTPGCTCADQWICDNCGTWHRWGKPYWSAARDEYVDDLVCTKCLKPRPSPLPVVPCVLLPQDYYRLAGTKPTDWGAASRRNIVIRAQESETLPMHQDLPRWKVRHKVRKGTAEYQHSHGNQDESGQKPHHARHRKHHHGHHGKHHHHGKACCIFLNSAML